MLARTAGVLVPQTAHVHVYTVYFFVIICAAASGVLQCVEDSTWLLHASDGTAQHFDHCSPSSMHIHS
jgi:hypothetical protein